MNSVAFSQWLENMKALPASAPQWTHAREFIAAATNIIEAKEAEHTQAAELDTLLNRIREQYLVELEYLRRNIGSAGAGFTYFGDALNAGTELEVLLLEYRSILTLQPTSYDDEERLSAARSNAGERLRVAIQEVNDLLSPSGSETEETAPEVTAEVLESREDEDQGQVRVGTPDDLADSVEESRTAEEATHSESSELILPEEQETKGALANDVGWPAPRPGQAESSDLDMNVRPTDKRQVDRNPEQEVVDRTFSGAHTVQTATTDDTAHNIPSVQLNPPQSGTYLSLESPERILASTSLNDLETLMWSLISEDDLSGAYWISKYLSEQGYKTSATPLLLKAVQGARWLSWDVDRFVTDLFDIVANYTRSEQSGAQELLEFAASIHATAVDPYSQMLDWLRTPECCPALEPIVRQISELPIKGVSLRPEYVRGLGESVTHNEAISSVCADARKWLEEAPMKHTRYGRANNVWKYLISENGQIREMLKPVVHDARSDGSKVEEGLRDWSQDPASGLINQIDRDLQTSRVPKPLITGDARNWLLKGIEDAKNMVEQWCRLVTQDNAIRAEISNTYLIEQVTDLRSDIQSSSRLAMEALSELALDSNPVEIAASALCAKRSLMQLLDTLDIESDSVQPVSPVIEELVLIIGNAESLDLAMARRLLWTDCANLDNAGVPLPDSLSDIVCDLAYGVRNEQFLANALEIQIERQDYRFLDIAINGVSDETKDSITARGQKAIQDSTATLEDYLGSVRRKVRQAARDGIIEIDDTNWINSNRGIENIASRGDTLNFPVLTEELEDIETGLQELAERRYAKLFKEWETVLTDRPDADSDGTLPWKEKFNAATDRRDIRVMEECLMRLSTGSYGVNYQHLSALDDTGDDAQNSLAKFIRFLEQVKDIEAHTRSSTGLAALRSRLSSLG